MSDVSAVSGIDRSAAQARIIYWLAIGTAFLSLLPIVLGSLVTTLGAGMAFLDWPTSDGQGMLTYPWLQSHGDKFIEHGHRLAGMLIGFCGIGLVVASWVLKASKTIRRATVIALVGIIIQGLIGGARVRLDQHTIALGHSVFGCGVFVVLWEVARLARPWNDTESSARESASIPQVWMGVGWPALCLLQYVLGAFLRHLGHLMAEHLGGAIVVAVAGAVVVWVSRQSVSVVRRRSRWVLVAVGAQILIGITAWTLKYGFAPLGYVAVQNSNAQIVMRSLHTVGGMCVIASAVAWSGAVLQVAAIRRRQSALSTT